MTKRRLLKLSFYIAAYLWFSSCDKQVSDFINQGRRGGGFSSGAIEDPGSGGGDSTAPVTPPSSLSYTSTSLKAFHGSAISTLSPTVTGTVSSYAISPALPTGLTLNSTTGQISGTPTANQAKTTHTVTASNSGGSTTYSLTISTGPTFTVNSTGNEADASTADGLCNDGFGVCSLRGAIQQANSATYPTKIVLPAGTIGLAGSEIAVTSDVTLVGASRATSIVTGSNSSRIFNVTTTDEFSVSKITLTAANSGSTASSMGGAIKMQSSGSLVIDDVVFSSNTTATSNEGGAAIYYNGSGKVTVTNSSFVSNSHSNGTGSNLGGGAIYLKNCGTGTLISRSTFNLNTSANAGGAIYSNGCSSATVEDSVFTSNSVSIGDGGAIFTVGGFADLNINRNLFESNTVTWGDGGAIYISNVSTAVIQNSTFYGNQASSMFSAYGGAIYISFGALTMPTYLNNTFENNSATTAGGAIFCASCASAAIGFKNTIFGSNSPQNCGGTFSAMIDSKGNNIDAGNTCGLNSAGDLTNTNPLLVAGAPTNNGGLINSIALQAGSPARDAGSSTGCPSQDQRGNARPNNGVCDIGAYEY